MEHVDASIGSGPGLAAPIEDAVGAAWAGCLEHVDRPEAFFGELTEGLAHLVGADAALLCSVYEHDEAGARSLRVLAQHGVAQTVVDGRLPPGTDPIAESLHTGRPAIAAAPVALELLGAGAGSIGAWPLVDRRGAGLIPAGIPGIVVASRGEGRPAFSSSAREAGAAMARRAATAFRVVQRLWRSSRGLVFDRVGAQLLEDIHGRVDDLQSLLGLALDGLIPPLGFGEGAVLLCDGEAGALPFRARRLERAAVRGRAIEVGSGRASCLGIDREAAALPLVFGEGPALGVVVVTQRHPRGRFWPDDLDWLQRCVDRLAISVHHLRAQAAQAAWARDVEAFACTIAHDLQGPVVRIRGLADLLESADPAERPEIMGRLRRATDHLGELGDALLDYQRLGREQVRAADTLLLPALRRVLKRHRVGHGDRPPVELDLPNPAVKLHIDPRHLDRIVDNAVGNMLRHAGGADQPRLRVAYSPGAATLRFEDDGPGVPPEDRERVFELFHRLGDRPGSGLGLASVRRCAELAGGGAWIEQSELGGCALCVRLLVAGEPDD